MSIVPSTICSPIVPGSTRVRYDNYIVFKRGDEVVGRMSAEFDFADLPLDMHWLAFQSLSPIIFCVPEYSAIELPCSSAAAVTGIDTKKWWQFWR